MLACGTCPMGVAALLGLLVAGMAVVAVCIAAVRQLRRKARGKDSSDEL